MTTPKGRKAQARTLGQVLTAEKARWEQDNGKRLTFGALAREFVHRHGLSTTDETIRSYHNDGGGEKRNPLLVAALVEFYGLKLSDIPADEAHRIVLALDLLKRISRGGGTPPGTRTRNLQDTGQNMDRMSAQSVTSHAQDSHPVAA